MSISTTIVQGVHVGLYHTNHHTGDTSRLYQTYKYSNSRLKCCCSPLALSSVLMRNEEHLVTHNFVIEIIVFCAVETFREGVRVVVGRVDFPYIDNIVGLVLAHEMVCKSYAFLV